MAINLDPKTKTYTVTHSKRHPLTRMPQRIARKGISSMAEAKRVEKDLVVKLEDKLRAKVVPTWQALVEKQHAEFLLSERVTRKTADNALMHLRAYTFECWGSRLVDSITTQEVREFVRTKVGDKSQGQQKNVLKFIRGAFQYALELGVINRDPTPKMKFQSGDRIKKVLTEPQARILLEKAKEYRWNWYPVVAAALYTGMRSGELFALSWDRVNLDERTIVVDSSWNNQDGFKSTKSGNDRIVEIAPPLLTIFKELKLKSDSAFVLPRIDGWEKGQQAAFLRTFLLGLGLPEIRFHDLRATWATLLLSKGVAPARVMMMGGWSDMKTMMIYMRKAGIDIRGSTDVLDLHNPSIETARVIRLPENGSA